ncbi:hypothetical protein C8F01DRAFT_1093808 [Mycena amicta]|nr:hypothetical protein C8F01DRAFT_1093808 [Mycena amicta]
MSVNREQECNLRLQSTYMKWKEQLQKSIYRTLHEFDTQRVPWAVERAYEYADILMHIRRIGTEAYIYEKQNQIYHEHLSFRNDIVAAYNVVHQVGRNSKPALIMGYVWKHWEEWDRELYLSLLNAEGGHARAEATAVTSCKLFLFASISMPGHLVCFPPFHPEPGHEKANDYKVRRFLPLVIRGHAVGAFTSTERARSMNPNGYTLIPCHRWSEVLVEWGRVCVHEHAHEGDPSERFLLVSEGPLDPPPTSSPWPSPTPSATPSATPSSVLAGSEAVSPTLAQSISTLAVSSRSAAASSGSSAPSSTSAVGSASIAESWLDDSFGSSPPGSPLRSISSGPPSRSPANPTPQPNQTFWCIEGVPRVFESFKQLTEHMEAESAVDLSATVHICSLADIRKVAALAFGLGYA